MPRIIASAHAFPAHHVTQDRVRELAERIFSGRIANPKGQLRVFENARVASRYLVRPPEWYTAAHSADECNRIYLDEGVVLLEEAARNCLKQAGIEASRVDHVICVSTTGYATPSMEARIFGTLGLSPATKRTPIWGLGCAAGAAGLARAREYCLAFPGARVLLLALELCSLTFQRGDVSQKNLIGTALFGDGAAAALVVGEDVDATGPRILATASCLFPGTERIMGWDFIDSGMQLVLSPKLPALILEELPTLVEAFLAGNGIARVDVRHYLFHPGGARVLDAYRAALALGGDDLALSENALRQYGNISSVTILLVLEQWLAQEFQNRSGYGLMAAFGPGFSAELLLLEC